MTSPTGEWLFMDAQYGLLKLAAKIRQATWPVLEIFKMTGYFLDSPGMFTAVTKTFFWLGMFDQTVQIKMKVTFQIVPQKKDIP